jgi:signal transduction histidine kinase
MDQSRDVHSRLQHDLRNSLNILLGFCNVLQKETLAPKHAGYVDRIRKAGEQMKQRLDDTVDVGASGRFDRIVESETRELIEDGSNKQFADSTTN